MRPLHLETAEEFLDLVHYFKVRHSKPEDFDKVNDQSTGNLTEDEPIVPVIPGRPAMKVPTWWKPPQTSNMVQQIQIAKMRK